MKRYLIDYTMWNLAGYNPPGVSEDKFQTSIIHILFQVSSFIIDISTEFGSQ